MHWSHVSDQYDRRYCDSRRQADLHRPSEPAAIAGEIRALARSGRTTRDTAAPMRVHEQLVREALRDEAA